MNPFSTQQERITSHNSHTCCEGTQERRKLGHTPVTVKSAGVSEWPKWPHSVKSSYRLCLCNLFSLHFLNQLQQKREKKKPKYSRNAAWGVFKSKKTKRMRTNRQFQWKKITKLGFHREENKCQNQWLSVQAAMQANNNKKTFMHIQLTFHWLPTSSTADLPWMHQKSERIPESEHLWDWGLEFLPHIWTET